ncbi:lipase family protein [Pseudoalteromonas shioyasakiensis]|uniref:lipase family protein n=1 Tax=Pseudoalteromonas shioyasakiensis TaxID=1190813 RepID=UPI0021184E2A|nr:lipase family protein [Pseudoalteromonas shioyasakiensis]MCQ8880515.1 lipase family protein [Pseudoalteromonas shioyasakiensis]
MRTLSPTLAVNLAEFAYESLTGKLDVPIVLAKQFLFNSKSSLKGVTGTCLEHVLNHSSGFGYIGEGRNGGIYEKEIVITFRGTAGIADTLTDLHCGMTVGPNYKAVHAGFNRTFESIKPQLSKILSKLGSRPVHCVGHSLGGAIATLAANWIKAQFKVPVKLYTFGAPRVGCNPFAIQTETNLNGIYRAVHRSDPVPMVPVWPFVHAGSEYRLSTCVSLTGAAHKMAGNAPGYINTASRYPDYKSMERGSLSNLTMTRLKYVNRHHASFNAHWADKITSALLTLLRESGKITSILAQGVVAGTLTIYDALARSLVEISKMSSKYAEDCKGVLGHILNFVGKPGVNLVDITYAKAKKILYWMLEKLNQLVIAAVKVSPYIGIS